MVPVKLGPFKQGELPRLSISRENVDPAGSLEQQVVPVDADHGYKLIYNFQNWGNKTAVVTIRRTGKWYAAKTARLLRTYPA